MPRTRSLALGICCNADTNRIFGTIRLRDVENTIHNEESENEYASQIETSRQSAFKTLVQHVKENLTLPNTTINVVNITPISYTCEETGEVKVEEVSIK